MSAPKVTSRDAAEASKWSADPPTEAGWYWFALDTNHEPAPIEVTQGLRYLLVRIPHAVCVSELSGLWCPMVPPEFPESLRTIGGTPL